MRRWLEERLGVGELWGRVAPKPVPGGPRWAHAWGKVLVGLLGLQVVTGVAMASFYAPSATTAWESVFYLQTQVPLGGWVRAVHATGAGVLVVLVVAHAVRLAWGRVYRAPRELTWWLGLALIPVLCGFALTGYLLPWDQKGYWATQVATGIARNTPVVGPSVARILQGGPELGHLTLTRFYALHSVVLPATLGALLALHVRAFRRHGPHGEGPATPYWPGQAGRDLALGVCVLGGVLGWAAWQGVGLEAPADPAGTYPPRPEWYFAPLRQLIEVAPEPWGSLVIPGLVAGLWAALPWIDRAERPRRGVARAIVVVPCLVALGLGIKAYVEDAQDAAYQAARAEAEAEAAFAQALAAEGIPPEGAAYQVAHHPPRWGARLFAQHCQRCHGLNGEGGGAAPDFTGFLSSAWLQGLIRDPQAPEYFGRTKIDEMPPLAEEALGELEALAAFVRAQDPAVALDPELVARGEEAFYGQDCFTCHGDLDAGEPMYGGPFLEGYGSDAWLRSMIADPGSDVLYCDWNEMPAFAGELKEAEVEALIAFLRTLEGE